MMTIRNCTRCTPEERQRYDRRRQARDRYKYTPAELQAMDDAGSVAFVNAYLTHKARVRASYWRTWDRHYAAHISRR